MHSGSSLHYGHYYTFLRNSDNEAFQWHQANDSSMTKVSLENLLRTQNIFKDDTPYIVFYERIKANPLMTNNSKVEVRKKLTEIIEQDNQIFEAEEKNRVFNKPKSHQFIGPLNKNSYSSKDDDDDTEDFNKVSSSGQNEGPRQVF